MVPTVVQKPQGGEDAKWRPAVSSTGLLNGLQSCRNDDVLSFLEMLSWHIASVELKVWTSDGLPLGLLELYRHD
jgi:hypothetical protein